VHNGIVEILPTSMRLTTHVSSPVVAIGSKLETHLRGDQYHYYSQSSWQPPASFVLGGEEPAVLEIVMQPTMRQDDDGVRGSWALRHSTQDWPGYVSFFGAVQLGSVTSAENYFQSRRFRFEAHLVVALALDVFERRQSSDTLKVLAEMFASSFALWWIGALLLRRLEIFAHKCQPRRTLTTPSLLTSSPHTSRRHTTHLTPHALTPRPHTSPHHTPHTRAGTPASRTPSFSGYKRRGTARKAGQRKTQTASPIAGTT